MLRTYVPNRPTSLHTLAGIGAIVVIALIVLNVLNVSASTTVTHDPEGDAILETGSPAPGYLDVKSVRITEHKGAGNIVFTCHVAAHVPAAFSDDVYHEFCGLSLNIGQAPPGIPGLPQYVVIVRWNTDQGFEGKLIDYTGGFPTTEQDIDIKITGPTVKAIVPSADIGSPEELTWLSLSREKGFVMADPSEGVTDVVPNLDSEGEVVLGTWTTGGGAALEESYINIYGRSAQEESTMGRSWQGRN